MSSVLRPFALAFACATSAALLLWLSAQPTHAQGGPAPGPIVNCVVTTSTGTTVALVGSPCLAANRDSGSSLYITDVLFSASAAGIGADAFPTLKYGTGTTCGTGTQIIWGALTAAAFVVPQQFKTPLRVPPGNDLCWISSTAGSKFLVVSGYTAP